jgi:hypothetical protein
VLTGVDCHKPRVAAILVSVTDLPAVAVDLFEGLLTPRDCCTRSAATESPLASAIAFCSVRAFEESKRVLGSKDFMIGLKAAFRERGEGDYRIIYPTDLTSFSVT